MLRYRQILVAAGLTAACVLRGQNPTITNVLSVTELSPSSPTNYMYFLVEGGTDQVLVRATGPSITQFSSTLAPLPDPVLTIYQLNVNTPVATNTGWSSDPAQTANLQAAFSNAPTYPYTVGSGDSAALVTVPPGLYIVHFTSALNNTGYVDGEIYDMKTSGRIAYVAESKTDSFIDLNFKVTSPDNALVRVLGPSLGADYGGSAPNNVSLVAAASNTPAPTSIPVTSDLINLAGLFPLVPGSTEYVAAFSLSGTYQLNAYPTSTLYGLAECALTDANRQNLAPVIYLPPSGGTYGVGTPLTLIAPFVAYPTPTSYSWSKDGNVLPAQTSSTLSIPSLQVSDAGSYTFTVTNAAGSATSAGAAIQVTAPVTFTSQPTNQFGNPGGSATFTVGATGTGSVTYQWYFNGSPISGATSSTLTLTNLTTAQFGDYAVYVTDNAGTTQSNAVTLSQGYSRIVNLSALAVAGDVLPGVKIGFSVGGSGTSGTTPFLVRGIGPRLADFGVTDFLADPNIKVYNNLSAAIGTNDNWGTNAAAITAADQAVNAFALTDPTSLDAAFTSTFSGGTYTAGVGGPGSGKALSELYDETPNAGPSAPRLINISALALVNPGGSLNAGFVINGTGTKQLLIRGVGPSLADHGVSNVLPTPTLTLYDVNNHVLATNTGWGSDANIASAAAAVYAFSLRANSPDCAMLVWLAPGQYTVGVSGVNNSSGDALVEVYEVQ